jgi:hypothetical protein
LVDWISVLQIHETKVCNVAISAMSSIPKSVTNKVEQTLTCKIEGLDDEEPVTVSWKETNDGPSLASDSNYSIEQGTVIDGTQNSVLTIGADKMATFTGSSFTYKCSAKSSQFPDSQESAYLDVVANVLDFGKVIRCNDHRLVAKNVAKPELKE